MTQRQSRLRNFQDYVGLFRLSVFVFSVLKLLFSGFNISFKLFSTLFIVHVNSLKYWSLLIYAVHGICFASIHHSTGTTITVDHLLHMYSYVHALPWLKFDKVMLLNLWLHLHFYQYLEKYHFYTLKDCF